MTHIADSTIFIESLAVVEAQGLRASVLEPGHFLLGILKGCDTDVLQMLSAAPPQLRAMGPGIESDLDPIKQIFGRFGIDQTEFRRRLRPVLLTNVIAPPLAFQIQGRSPECTRVLRRADSIAFEGTVIDTKTRPIHLLRSIAELPGQPWAVVLSEMGHSPSLLSIFEDGPIAVEADSPAGIDPVVSAPEGVGEEVPRHPTPTLDRYGRDLTNLAKIGRLSPVIGRDREIRRIARTLVRRSKSNVMLLGDPGVGKTCVVEGLAQWLISDEADVALAGKRVIDIQMSALVAGSAFRGEFEDRVKSLVEEAQASDDVILFVDEFHTAVGAGAAPGGMDAANILKPALARGGIKMIAATTTSEFRQYIEKDEALVRRFEQIVLDEPTREEAVEILQGLKPGLESHHELAISDDALEAAVELSMRYIQDFRLPDKAIDIVDQACANLRIGSISANEAVPRREVGRDDIAKVVSDRTRVPVERLGRDEAKRLLSMEQSLGARVRGQEEAVSAVSNAVRTARAGLKPPNQPVGVFLFGGATGTGKTELAKALAEFLFDDDDRLVRIDMSEYQQEYTVSRLIGAPPGYVGHDEEGQLTGPVRTNPYSVVLFDEVEKAHPKILDIFLQIFDDGRLTDAHGRNVSFSETLIIMTSNLGSSSSGGAPVGRPVGLALGREDGPVGESGDEMEKEAYRGRIDAAVRAALRPELYNRIQKIVVFHPLNQETIRGIIDKFIGELRSRTTAEYEVEIQLTDAAYEHLMVVGFDPELGAREMARAIDRGIREPLGALIIGEQVKRGETVWVDVRDGGIVFAEGSPSGAILGG